MQWLFPFPHCAGFVVPVHGALGAFGTVRKHDVHTGIDLYAPEGSELYAVEAGTVVAIEPFTGPEAGSPWWLSTQAILVEGASGVVLYGEIAPSVSVGLRVERGTKLGHIQRVLRNDKGKPTSMLHIEQYTSGTRSSVWWHHGEEKPVVLLDPTTHLCSAEHWTLHS